MSDDLTLREVVEALYALAAEHQRPGLDPDVIQVHPCDHIIHEQINSARQLLQCALRNARREVAPRPVLVPATDGGERHG